VQGSLGKTRPAMAPIRARTSDRSGSQRVDENRSRIRQPGFRVGGMIPAPARYASRMGAEGSTEMPSRWWHGLQARGKARRGSSAARACWLLAVAGLAVTGCSGALGKSAGPKMSVSTGPEVLLVPNLYAGLAGWCLIRVNAGGEGGCGGPRTNPPIIAEQWSSGGPPAVTTAYAITASNVAAVRPAGGSAVPTSAEKSLPDGLRGVAVEIRGKELLSEDSSLPHFVPLDAHGNAIPQAGGSTWKAANAGTIATSVPTMKVPNPASWTEGLCRFAATPNSAFRVLAGAVITAARPATGLVGQGFLTCADARYGLHGFPLMASILLNAAHPGQAPPALPAMTPLAGHAGIFEAPDEDASPTHEMLARRIKGAWVVVAKGENVETRLKLLERIHPTVNL
jgi:hypothetical protein